MRSYKNIRHHLTRFSAYYAAVFIALWPQIGLSGSSSYICKITDFRMPDTEFGNRDWLGETAKETTVAIDRVTGRVIHSGIGNTFLPRIEVIDIGSDNWSFKVIARSSPSPSGSSHVRYYEVSEYATGLAKPFLAVIDGMAFFGLCE